MNTAANDRSGARLALSLDEQWAVHQALLDYVEVAVQDHTDFPYPTVALTVIEKIEDGYFAFTPREFQRLRAECDRHARSEHAPERDRAPARAVVNKIDRLCGPPTQ